MSIRSLLDLYNTLPPGNIYHDAIRNLLRLLPEIRTKSIHELAELCYTNPSTLSRLAKLNNNRSFAELREDLISGYEMRRLFGSMIPEKEVAGRQPLLAWADFHHRMIETICDTVTDARLQEIAASLRRAERITICIPEQPDAITTALQFQLIAMGKEVVVLRNYPLDMETILHPTEKDLFLFCFALTPVSAPRVYDLLGSFHSVGAKLLAVVSTSDAVLYAACEKYCDHILTYPRSQVTDDYYYFLHYMELLSITLSAQEDA